jgi:hypothetical protein
MNGTGISRAPLSCGWLSTSIIYISEKRKGHPIVPVFYVLYYDPTKSQNPTQFKLSAYLFVTKPLECCTHHSGNISHNNSGAAHQLSGINAQGRYGQPPDTTDFHPSLHRTSAPPLSSEPSLAWHRRRREIKDVYQQRNWEPPSDLSKPSVLVTQDVGNGESKRGRMANGQWSGEKGGRERA